MLRWTALVILLSIIACTKEGFLEAPDARIRISADTLRFDTVFVTAGSTYRSFTLANDYDQKVLIRSVTLGGGNQSPFKLNFNGQVGSRLDNVVIEKKDSLYGWVQVNIDPTNNMLPFVLRDSIVIEFNEKIQKIQLEAWGRNAHFIRNGRITQSQTWSNDKPYVILGGLTIEPNTTLALMAGVNLYMHADAPIVVKGNLLSYGLADSARRVRIQGDRLDEPYRNLPGAWPGIFIQPGSTNNVFRYTIIRQAYQAMVAEQGSNAPNLTLKLEQCEIDNAYESGLIGVNSSIYAENCLISNCGQNAVLIGGGNYLFTHCTLASYANRYLDHQKPVLTVTNFNGSTSNSLQAQFRNCIFWGENGTVEDEVLLAKNSSAPYQVLFQNVLWKMRSATSLATTDQVINNQSPLFDSIQPSRNYYNFRLRASSPALNAGMVTGLTLDLDGRPRAVGLPDLGCYEKQ
ncbi:MAG: hypothetical protein ACKO6Q_02905 [Bacteroidota bacterium]